MGWRGQLLFDLLTIVSVIGWVFFMWRQRDANDILKLDAFSGDTLHVEMLH